MAEAYIGALDQGTTGTRFAIFDHGGNEVAHSYLEHRQIYPRPGWVEHDPVEVYENAVRTMREALRRSGVGSSSIEAIGVTNQRETTILWNGRTGLPVANAVVWQCRRSAPLVEKLREDGMASLIRDRTGLPLDAYFSGTKIQWMMENIPGVRELADAGDLLFGTMDSWLIWKLTGSHVTDPSNASRTMLYDIHRNSWDEELLEAMGGLSDSILPQIRPSSDPNPYGHVDDSILGSELPVCGDLGDQQAALFGQGCFREDEAKCTFGTGSFILMNTGTEPYASRRGVTTIAYRIGDDGIRYALEAPIFVTGSAIQWLRDGLGLIENAEETEDLARSVPDTGGVYFVPCFTGLGAPHWNMYARGTLVGLTGGTRRAHLIRATLEAECYHTRDALEALSADSGATLHELRADGGGSRNVFLMQFQADVLGKPVRRSAYPETTSLGAAFCAGLASGFWKDLEELRRIIGKGELFEPSMPPAQRAVLYRGWRRALGCSLAWAEGQTRERE